jgi:hypothetical protein
MWLNLVSILHILTRFHTLKRIALKNGRQYSSRASDVRATWQGNEKVCLNITGWPKSWYVYYRVIKKLVWILQGDQKVGMNITGWSKMNKIFSMLRSYDACNNWLVFFTLLCPN